MKEHDLWLICRDIAENDLDGVVAQIDEAQMVLDGLASQETLSFTQLLSRQLHEFRLDGLRKTRDAMNEYLASIDEEIQKHATINT